MMHQACLSQRFSDCRNMHECYSYLKSCKILYKSIGGIVHQFKQLILLNILVLIQKPCGRVCHCPCVMQYTKLLLPCPPVITLDIVWMFLQLLVLFYKVGLVCSLQERQYDIIFENQVLKGCIYMEVPVSIFIRKEFFWLSVGFLHGIYSKKKELFLQKATSASSYQTKQIKKGKYISDYIFDLHIHPSPLNQCCFIYFLGGVKKLLKQSIYLQCVYSLFCCEHQMVEFKVQHYTENEKGIF